MLGQGQTGAPAAALAYRPEIDGLRAIAVLSVILFHAGFSQVGGGFVGVDIFFVISGYLITGIILGELAEGRFSILRFYERRARRILPALGLVVFATWPIAWAVMLPTERTVYSETLLSVAAFVSNFLFGSEMGYFVPNVGERPLLHTWSLSVEEQYYVVFPPLMILAWKLGRAVPALIIAGLAGVSLAIAEYGWRHSPDYTFFFTGARAWELMAGALCALAERRWGRWRSDAGAALGLAMMLVAIFLFTEETPMPSLYTLIPVAGAGLAILTARPGGAVQRLLSLPVMVGIGLVSYSAYLWHQPVFALVRVARLDPPSPVMMAGLIVVTLALAWASWRYVETPFRRKVAPVPPDRRRVFVWSAATLFIMADLGLMGMILKGNEAGWLRNNPEAATAYRLVTATSTASELPADAGDCKFNILRFDPDGVAQIEDCARRYGPALVVLGDSHAINVFGAMAHVADTPFLIGVTNGGCEPAEPLTRCSYVQFEAFLADHPGLVGRVIYSQAGSNMMQTPEGTNWSWRTFLKMPLAQPLPDLQPDTEEIDVTIDYLARIAARVPVTWIAPRIEPQVPFKFAVRLGCDAGFALRPGLREAFDRLDREIARRVAARGAPGLVYADLALQPAFDMAQDFMSCDVVYWADGHHWSLAGELRFGRRLLEAGLPGLDGLVAKPPS